MKILFTILIFLIDLNSSFALENSGLTPSPTNLSFMENKGQVKDQFGNQRNDIDMQLSLGNGLSIFIGKGTICYQFSKPEFKHGLASSDATGPEQKGCNRSGHTMYRMDVNLLGTNSNSKMIKDDVQQYYENHFTGDQMLRCSTFGRIIYKDIYPKIDWVLYVRNGKLKHEFRVRKGGNPDDIKLQYNGATELQLNKQGDLIAKTPLGSITEQAPVSFQENGKIVSSSFRLKDQLVTYQIGRHYGDMIIDPYLDWSTYYGDWIIDEGTDIKVDLFGNVYLTGFTENISGIATSGAFQTVHGGDYDAFLVKFDANGKRLWATYYGGANDDGGESLVIDSANNVYMGGFTSSTSGIATSGSHQPAAGWLRDAFIAKFDPTGARIWATFYGGTANETNCHLALDYSGKIYLSGSTGSNINIASAGSYQAAFAGGDRDAFLAKFDSTGKRLWGTYYGGFLADSGTNVCVDKKNNVYICGQTYSSSAIATTGSHQQSYRSSRDAFLVKFDSTGARLWGTYYGGYAKEWAYDVHTDESDNVYLCGATLSNTGIATSGAHKENWKGGLDAFLVKFSASGLRLWATYYGDTNACAAFRVANDRINNVYIAGYSEADSSIATPGSFQPLFAGGVYDGMIVKFDSTGSRIWGSYFGGPNIDLLKGFVIDESDHFYISGTTSSKTNIATVDAHQTSWAGVYDAYVAKFCNDKSPISFKGADTLCAKQSMVLLPSRSGGNYYSKTGRSTISGNTVTGLTVGQDTIIYVMTNQCYNDTTLKELFILPAPDAGTVTLADTLCIGTIYPIVTSVAGGFWASRKGKLTVTAGSVDVLSSGIDTLLYIVTNDCGNDTTVKIVYLKDCNTGIEEIKVKSYILIQPNPASDRIQITANVKLKSVLITNILGQVVYLTESLSGNQHLVTVALYPKGLYLITVNQEYVTKLVKE